MKKRRELIYQKPTVKNTILKVSIFLLYANAYSASAEIVLHFFLFKPILYL